jgi:hypothetical protein
LNNVPPGDYSLDVQQRPQNMRNLGARQLEFASVPVSVAGDDISGLTILTTPGISVSGRVVFEGQKTQSTTARGMQISATASSGLQSIMGLAGRMIGGGRIDENGTFELRGILGPQSLRVTGVPNGWVLKSITLEGEDITDVPYDFKAGSNVTGIVITLTDRVTDVSGIVRDSRGEAVKDYVLVVFPEDPELWVGNSRFVRTTRPNQEGSFSLKGLPPARYLAAVIDSLENGAQNDPAVLEQLRPRARRFELTEGQTLSLTLDMAAIQ